MIISHLPYGYYLGGSAHGFGTACRYEIDRLRLLRASQVDDIWAKLKASQGAGKPAVGGVNLEKLWQGFSSDPKSGKIAAKQQPNASKVQQPTGTADSTARQAACDTATVPQPAPGRGVGDGGLGGSTFTSAGSTAASGSLTAVKPSPEAAQQLVARYVAGLKDSSQSTRRKALQDIKASYPRNGVSAWVQPTGCTRTALLPCSVPALKPLDSPMAVPVSRPTWLTTRCWARRGLRSGWRGTA